MPRYERALTVYRDGRLIVEATRELAVQHDNLRWLREDLEEALLDLKLAWLDLDTTQLDDHLIEVMVFIADIRRFVQGLSE